MGGCTWCQNCRRYGPKKRKTNNSHHTDDIPSGYQKKARSQQKVSRLFWKDETLYSENQPCFFVYVETPCSGHGRGMSKTT